MSLQKFVDSAVAKYGIKYSYDNVVYINANTHVTITCPKHGNFTTTPKLHLHRTIECKQCKHEHKLNTLSSVTHITCSKCDTTKPVAEFFRSKRSPTGHETRCKECYSVQTADYYSQRPNLAKECRQRYQQKTNHRHSRQWYSNNKEHFSTYRKIWYYANRNYILLQQGEYRKSATGKAKRQVYDAARRTALTKCTPGWCNPPDILEIYKRCVETTLSTGVLHEVDHYYPINGKLVCGLHVPLNLRIIAATENRSKGNKHPDEFYSV